jgi:hypothetical protein
MPVAGLHASRLGYDCRVSTCVGENDGRPRVTLMLHTRLTRRWRGPASRRRTGGGRVVPEGALASTCFGSVPEPERDALNAFLAASRCGIQGTLGESSDRAAAE